MDSLPIRDRRALLLAVMVAAFCFGSILTVDVPLIDLDEGRHAAIAQEMVERGDYVTPSLLGRPFFDKPILFFWMQAASLQVFGMHEVAVRLPGLLCGFLGALTTGLLGWRLFGRSAGLLAGLFHATMILPTALAQAAVHDVALVPWTNLALLALWESGIAPERRLRWRWTIAAGVLAGVSILTKGLIGVAFVGLTYGLFLIITRRVDRTAFAQAFVILLLAAFVAAPWYVAMSLRNPEYAYYYFVERHLLGFASDTQRHGERPWWYYVPILLGGCLPWTTYLPACLRDWWTSSAKGGATTTQAGPGEHSSDARRAARQLVWLWLVACFAFLTLAHSKMPTYMLPVFPAVSLLAADLWTRFLQRQLAPPVERLVHLAFWVTSVPALLLVPGILFATAELADVQFAAWQWGLAIGCSLLAAVPLWLWRRGLFTRTLTFDLGLLGVQFFVVITYVLPSIAQDHSARRIAAWLNERETLPRQVLFLEERVGSVLFYLRPDFREQLQAERLKRVNLWEFTTEVDAAADVLVIIPEREREKLSASIDLSIPPQATVDRFRIYTADTLLSREQKNIPRVLAD